MTAKKVLVPIADGSEEIETTCIQDTLARFGVKVTIASVKPNKELVCTMSRGIKILADVSIEDVVDNEYDMIVLPGGMPGAEHLRDSATLTALLQKQKAAGKWYGAICASPAVALQSNGLLDDDAVATCYPAPVFRDKFAKHLGSSDDAVVVSKNLVTSKGPATAILFGLQLGELLYGKEKRDKIASEMLV
jgi:4-methyl-5(b-hydroxyethyl)-thiazole monophosphate biosynthesis